MDEQPILPAEVRASLPPVVQADVAFLESQIALLRDQVAALQATVTKLQGQLAGLQARVHQNSGNSSRPPSSDPPGTRPHLQSKPSGRKRGGQKGHPGHARLQLGADQIAAQIEHRPVQCPGCTFPLEAILPAEGEPIRVQVWEIPPIAAEVTEHRGYRVRCPHCAALVPPPDLPEGAFGPRLTAMGGLLHGRFRLSMRETTAVFADLFGVPMGPGSISTLCQEVAAALDEPDEDVRTPVEAETRANVDETGWKQAGERRWLWVAVTALCTLFVVAKNRSAAVLVTVLGEAFTGVVGSDRYKAYLSIPIERRQIWWYRSKDSGGGRAQLQAEIAPLRTRLRTLWERGSTLPSWMARAICNDVRQLEPTLWTFVTVEGVEPTNNAAERALRPAGLWRKGCYGADSAAGNAFVAKILTVAATCRQQQKPLLTYLTGSVAAHRSGYPVPSLIAAPRSVG